MRELIFRLARPLLGLFGRDERGAVGVLIAVLIGGGVLMGIGALVIDVGQIYQERAQLQNGADAGALAVARTCANGACSPSAAVYYADHNASNLTGGVAKVDTVCGSGPGLTACSGPIGSSLANCPQVPAGTTDYVDVHTSTLMPSGSTLLPPVFARLLVGNGNYQGTDVGACARAQWGTPKGLPTIAFTISACTWDASTQQGKSYGPAPQFTATNPQPTLATYPHLDQALVLHSSHSDTGCKTEPAGADAPGVFGWTDTIKGTCTLDITGGPGTLYGVSTGTSVSNPCKEALSTAQNPADPSLVYIPVYVSVKPGTSITSSQGNQAYYTLKGYAAFVVTGYHLPSFDATDWLDPSKDCTGSTFCINGYFTQALVPYPPGGKGPSLGLTGVSLTG